MTKLYAVHGGESIFTVVKADSEKEAFDIFAENQIDDESLVEQITEFITNASILEDFYRDEEGHFLEEITGDYPERLAAMDDEDRVRYINGWIEKNVKEFWNDQPQFAEDYLNELYKSRESDEYYTGQFSKAFMIDTIKRIINGGKWYNDFEIVEIDLSDSNYQLVYEE
jgi:hypothetical protein